MTVFAFWQNVAALPGFDWLNVSGFDEQIAFCYCCEFEGELEPGYVTVCKEVTNQL